MAENFADLLRGCSRRAQRALFLGRLKGGQRGADVLEIEDLLVGLILEDQGGFQKAISDLPGLRGSAAQADPWPHRPFLPPELAADLLARAGELLTQSQPLSPAEDVPVSEGVRRVFARAAGLRNELRQSTIEPLHVLAAIAEDESSRAAQLLRAAGISGDKVVLAIREEERSVVEKTLSLAERFVGVAAGSPLYSLRARQVLFLARLKARARGFATIEIGDLLVALLVEDRGGFAMAASEVPGLGTDAPLPHPHRPFLAPGVADDLIARVESLSPRSRPLLADADVLMSTAIKRALATADGLRDRLRQGEVQPLHLLAAILRDEADEGAQLFRNAGITYEKVLKALRGESA